MSGERSSARYEMVASTRRQFSRDQKRTIVAEVERGATVSEVARRHNVHTSLLFRWRREFANASSPVSAAPQIPEPKTATLLPVRVAAPDVAGYRSRTIHRSASIGRSGYELERVARRMHPGTPGKNRKAVAHSRA